MVLRPRAERGDEVSPLLWKIAEDLIVRAVLLDDVDHQLERWILGVRAVVLGPVRSFAWAMCREVYVERAGDVPNDGDLIVNWPKRVLAWIDGGNNADTFGCSRGNRRAPGPLLFMIDSKPLAR